MSYFHWDVHDFADLKPIDSAPQNYTTKGHFTKFNIKRSIHCEDKLLWKSSQFHGFIDESTLTRPKGTKPKISVKHDDV